jgi:LacI family transcriptional regulator
MAQSATLKKIANQLNISISTVSRALKNHPDISEKTKMRVKELAAVMEYEPNAYAVNLRTNKSQILGIIVPSISNMFYESFIAAVEGEARKSGYSLIILQSNNDPIQEEENMNICKQSRVDGIMISVVQQSYAALLYEKFKNKNIPVVFFDIVPDNDSLDTICLADKEAAILAANTILKFNKKNVLALFGHKDLSITKKRKEAFQKKIRQENTDIALNIQHASSTEEARLITAKVFTGSPLPDLVFCMSDEILIGAMKFLNKSGLRIPEEVSVLAISNGFIPGLYNPEITYVETSGHELGKLAIKRMLENLSSPSGEKSILLPSRLVEGGSVA